MSEALKVEQLDGVGVWTFDRPQARNAIDESMVEGLERALEGAERDVNLRAVVLTGSGQAAFVSGADLKFLRQAPPALREANDARMLSLMDRLEQLPVPVIAALNGAVVGGGSEIALACDLRIAEPHASITFKHAAMGVSPGWGGLGRLAGLVGRSCAAKLLFTALPITAEEARSVGLVDELVAPGQALARARELAEAIAQVSPSTVADMKRLLWLTYAQGPERAKDEERRTFLARARSPDHAEALAAFFERRSPAYRPRGQG